MEIIAHRSNIAASLTKRGFEFDVWNYAGRLVVCHDAEECHRAPSLEKMLPRIAECEGTVLLNLKSEQNYKSRDFQRLLTHREKVILIDGSGPELLTLRSMGFQIANRCSEVERPSMPDFDAFWIAFWGPDAPSQAAGLEALITPCPVPAFLACPSLRGVHHELFWKKLKSLDFGEGHVGLCTKLVDEAEEFFNA